ncbi:hypothetical protein D3C86_1571620 [compost metagenome]
MRIPGTAGHQQHRLLLQLAQGVGHVQRVGHHHQAGTPVQLGDQRCGGAAAVDDDPRMLADAGRSGTGDGLLVRRHRLARFGDQLVGHRQSAAVATQQQTIALQRSQVLADGHFRGFEVAGQRVHVHLALLGEQGEDGVATLRCVAFRHA